MGHKTWTEQQKITQNGHVLTFDRLITYFIVKTRLIGKLIFLHNQNSSVNVFTPCQNEDHNSPFHSLLFSLALQYIWMWV